jgi:4-amino-4-deoxy-L-arabinose transferase-like glycosyltransferase
MRHLLRKSPLYFALLTAAAVTLRLFFVIKFPNVSGDAFFYGDLAKNWLQHGILGTTDLGGIHPSLIRLPGYPAFLGTIWAIVGVEHYRAVLLVQIFVDVGTCFLIADLARRVLGSEKGTKIAFLLAPICPFTANYVASALTETLAIFLAALALDLTVKALDSERLPVWGGCGAAVGASILLRPDGGILLAAVLACLAICCWRDLARHPFSRGSLPAIRAGVYAWAARAAVVSAVALAPLVPWTIRNWRDFHVLQPLAPRYANAPDQFVPIGFQRWVKTWMIDYVSVAEIYWQLDDGEIDISKAPQRAFDSAEERQSVEQLFATYNLTRNWTPALDTDLGRVADARVARHRVRYYLSLPVARILDMWLRPRTEMLGLDDRWWQFEDDPHDAIIAMSLGAINLFYVSAASVGFFALVWSRRAAPPVLWCSWGMLLTFVVLRSLFLGTLENPEPRYTLECYPVIIVLAAAALAKPAKDSSASKGAGQGVEINPVLAGTS